MISRDGPPPSCGRRHKRPGRVRGETGSASLWVLAAGLLVLLLALAAGLRESAVLARHRAETAADLAALATAQGIGVDASTDKMCRRAARIAAANGATVQTCLVRLDADGRSGTANVVTTVSVSIAGLGEQRAHARAQAQRLTSVAEP